MYKHYECELFELCFKEESHIQIHQKKIINMHLGEEAKPLWIHKQPCKKS